MTDQISHVTSSAWYHLHRLGQIRKFLDLASAARLIHAFITARLDQNNGLLYGVPAYQTHKLQRVQNAAARMLTLQSPSQILHITPILFDLHWLPVLFRIEYKLLLLVYKALNGLAPHYLRELLHIRHHSERSLRSNNNFYLDPPAIKTSKSYGDRAFQVAGPKLWNGLPIDIKKSCSVDIFKKRIKTYLFNEAFKNFK